MALGRRGRSWSWAGRFRWREPRRAAISRRGMAGRGATSGGGGIDDAGRRVERVRVECPWNGHGPGNDSSAGAISRGLRADGVQQRPGHGRLLWRRGERRGDRHGFMERHIVAFTGDRNGWAGLLAGGVWVGPDRGW